MKTMKKIPLPPHERRNYYMMMFDGRGSSYFEKFYDFTKTDLCEFIRRVYFPRELYSERVTENVKHIMQEVYMATAELKLTGISTPSYGGTVDYLLFMFKLTDLKRRANDIDEGAMHTGAELGKHSEHSFIALQAWSALTIRQRTILELWMRRYSSSAIGGTVGEGADSIGQIVVEALDKVRDQIKKLEQSKPSILVDKKLHAGPVGIDTREFKELLVKYQDELRCLARLPSTGSPEGWDRQVRAGIKAHLQKLT